MTYTIKLEGEKYTVINDNGIMHFLRYGDPWPAADDLKHTGVVLAMAQRIEELETAIRRVLRGTPIGTNCYADDGMVSYDADMFEGTLEGWRNTLRRALEQKL